MTSTYQPPPRGIVGWLGLLPAVYFVSLFSVTGLGELRKLPRPVQLLLGFYVLSQFLPAFLAPQVLLALGYALARSVLVLGLIGWGVRLKDSRQLQWMLVGLVLVGITALVYTQFARQGLSFGRLSHPYYTSVSLGLAGAAIGWLTLFGRGAYWWRVPAGVLGMVVLLLSGSRGPLLAFLVGSLAAIFLRYFSRRGALVTLAVAGVGLALLVGLSSLNFDALQRLRERDAAGRDVIWQNVSSIIHTYPLAGVGSYQLGTHLIGDAAPCEFFTGEDGNPRTCPAWLSGLGRPWIIAHNAALQQLAETGPLGLLGLLTLISVALSLSWVSRDSLGFAMLTGLVVASVTDNTLLVPSPFFAELFWLTVGVQLGKWQVTRGVAVPSATAGVALGVLAVLGAPVLMTTWAGVKGRSTNLPEITWLYNPVQVTPGQEYSAYVRLKGQNSARVPQSYRLSLNACAGTCQEVAQRQVTLGQEEQVVLVSGKVLTGEPERMELRLLPGQASLNYSPLWQLNWPVREQP